MSVLINEILYVNKHQSVDQRHRWATQANSAWLFFIIVIRHQAANKKKITHGRYKCTGLYYTIL